MTTKPKPDPNPADDPKPAEQEGPRPLTPDEAVKKAVETVRAPYEAIREAQRKARAEADEETLGSTGFTKGE